MSYLAIARKYRPATFEEMVGQEHVTRTLENALRTGRIHHAYLFTGARGVGKTTAARALARALNCAEGPTAHPCGRCTSCLEIASGVSTDLVEVDGASNNSVDDVRELRETVHYAPNGRYRIYLIDEVHMLSKAAFNALLKTLEEPPPHVVFLFATTEPQKILDTILSRVQRFDFKRIPASAVVQRLAGICEQEGAQISEAGLRMIARAGDGSMRDSESLLDKVISFAKAGEPLSDADVADTLGLIDRSLLYATLTGLVLGEPARCLDAIDEVYNYGHELSQYTSDLLELVRHATFVRLSDGAARHVDLPAEELARLTDAVREVPPEALSRLFTALLEVHDQVSRAARPRIVLEMAMARLATVRPVQPLTALVERLEGLEHRLRGSGAHAPVRGLREGPRASAPPAGPSSPTPRSPPAAPRRPPSSGEAPEGRSPTMEPSSRPLVVEAPVAIPEPAPAPASAPNRPDDDDGPPPWDDSPWFELPDEPPPVRHGSHRDPMDAWPTFQDRVVAMGPPFAGLAEATPAWQGRRLVLQLPAGPALARGRRALERDEVQQLFRFLWPEADALDTAPLPGTGTDRDKAAALRAEVLGDPDCDRILRALGATLDNVTSLRD